MKKIYLLLVLLFTGLQSVFAQFIWHPDLGTPYAGAISLPWNTRSYMFQVDNGEEFGSPGDIWDALDAQLRAAGITWIRVNSVENPADGTFEVWFDLDENKDNMSRSIHMGYSYSAYFSFSAKRSINSRHPHNDGVRKPRLTPLQWICARDKSAIRLCSMPSVRGWILIPYLPHKAIKSSVSTNPPSRKAASARFNDVLSRASSCHCRHFPVRSALVPVFGLPQHTVRAYGRDAPSTAGHPNPVLRRLPRKTTESIGGSPYGVAQRLAGCELPQSALRYIPCGAFLCETYFRLRNKRRRHAV